MPAGKAMLPLNRNGPGAGRKGNEQAMFRDLHLETTSVIIRPFTMGDAAALHAILRQEDVMRFLPESVMSLEEVREILAWIIDCYDKNSPEQIIKFTVAVTLRDTGELIGWVGLGPLDFEPSQIELFYGMDKAFWGRGLATEAARAMLGYGFNKLGRPRIVAVVHPDNAASIGVIEKTGLKYERTVGSLSPEHKAYEGDYYYSLTRKEFERLGSYRTSGRALE